MSDTAGVDEPGTYLLCAWLQEQSNAPATAATSLTIDVRSAVATLAIAGPKRLRPGRPRAFTFSGAAELERHVYARVKRTGGQGCGSAYQTDAGDTLTFFEQVQGNFSFPDAPSEFDIRERGRYLICAWVQESSSDLAPEAAASRTFRVRPRLNACKRAKRSLRKAKRADASAKRVRRARRAVRRRC